MFKVISRVRIRYYFLEYVVIIFFLEVIRVEIMGFKIKRVIFNLGRRFVGECFFFFLERGWEFGWGLIGIEKWNFFGLDDLEILVGRVFFYLCCFRGWVLWMLRCGWEELGRVKRIIIGYLGELELFWGGESLEGLYLGFKRKY